MKEIIIGISILTGTIIGGGIFALPYTFFKGGFLLSTILLLVITISICFLHLLYLEIIQQNKKPHRFVGYIQENLGNKFKIIATILIFGSFWASLLIYLILGANFLSHLFRLNFNTSLILFFSFGSILIYLGLRKISLIQVLGSLFLTGTIVILFLKAIPKINPSFISYDINLKNFFLPYGALLYSLYGRAAIPEISSLISSFKKQKFVIIFGTILPAILYFLFILTILTTSKNVFPFPEKNLSETFGKNVVFLFNSFGFFSVFTSFLIIGSNLKETFSLDFSLSKNLSFFLTISVPLFFYFLGVNNFIKIIDFCGGVFIAINSILLLLTYLKLKQKRYPLILPYLLIFVFVLGLLWQGFNLFKIVVH